MAKKNQEGGAPAADTLVFKVADLHCEGCAGKLKKSLRHITGVDGVKVDYSAKKVTVVGKVDPALVITKAQEKMNLTLHLQSPPPPKTDPNVVVVGGGGGAKNADDKPAEKKTNKAKEGPRVVVLKTSVHCDGCAVKMKKTIRKYQGVESVKVDLSKDQITLKGTMDTLQMVPFLAAKFKRPVEELVEKKADGGGGGDAKAKDKAKDKAAAGVSNVVDSSVNKMEYMQGYPNYGYVYDPQPQQVAPLPGYGYGYGYGYAGEYAPSSYNSYVHAPHMFSDENPNACSIM